MEESNTWQIDIRDYCKLTKEMSDFIVQKSELALKAKLSSMEMITNRADKLIALYVPIITGLGIYNLNNFNSIFKDYLHATALICLIVSLFGIYFCWLNIKEYKVGDIGEEPNKMMTAEYVDNNLSPDLKYISLCIALCKNIQLRMDFNDRVIATRSLNNQRAIKFIFLLAICPLISLLMKLVVTFLCDSLC